MPISTGRSQVTASHDEVSAQVKSLTGATRSAAILRQVVCAKFDVGDQLHHHLVAIPHVCKYIFALPHYFLNLLNAAFNLPADHLGICHLTLKHGQCFH